MLQLASAQDGKAVTKIDGDGDALPVGDGEAVSEGDGDGDPVGKETVALGDMELLAAVTDAAAELATMGDTEALITEHVTLADAVDVMDSETAMVPVALGDAEAEAAGEPVTDAVAEALGGGGAMLELAVTEHVTLADAADVMDTEAATVPVALGDAEAEAAGEPVTDAVAEALGAMLELAVGEAEALKVIEGDALAVGGTHARRTTEPLPPEVRGAVKLFEKFCATGGPAPTNIVSPVHETPGTVKLIKLEPPPPPLPSVLLTLPSPHAPPPPPKKPPPPPPPFRCGRTIRPTAPDGPPQPPAGLGALNAPAQPRAAGWNTQPGIVPTHAFGALSPGVILPPSPPTPRTPAAAPLAQDEPAFGPPAAPPAAWPPPPPPSSGCAPKKPPVPPAAAAPPGAPALPPDAGRLTPPVLLLLAPPPPPATATSVPSSKSTAVAPPPPMGGPPWPTTGANAFSPSDQNEMMKDAPPPPELNALMAWPV